MDVWLMVWIQVGISRNISSSATFLFIVFSCPSYSRRCLISRSEQSYSLISLLVPFISFTYLTMYRALWHGSRSVVPSKLFKEATPFVFMHSCMHCRTLLSVDRGPRTVLEAMVRVANLMEVSRRVSLFSFYPWSLYLISFWVSFDPKTLISGSCLRMVNKARHSGNLLHPQSNQSCFSPKNKQTSLAVLGLSCSTWDLVPWSDIEHRPPALGV